MTTEHAALQNVLDRRTFLTASTLSFFGLHGSCLHGQTVSQRHHAQSTILIWLSGGASHLDTWDMKPDAPAEYRGEFQPSATSASGVRLCEHLPMTARQAHHLAIVNSLGHNGRGTGDHHAGYYYNLTGREPDPTFRQLLNERKPMPGDWPFMGSVIAAKKPPHPSLPSLITLPQKPGAPRYTRPGQFSARLGLPYDPFYLLGSRDRPLAFSVPALSLEGEITAQRLTDRRNLLNVLDQVERRADRAATTGYSAYQDRAFAMLTAPQTRGAFDLTRESPMTRDRYGSSLNAMSMLMARRLVEAGVPFVSVFWMEDPALEQLCLSGGGWDTHGNNFHCLKQHLLPEFDRCYSALLDDLHQRGLLNDTLVLVNSEMGRKPRIGDPRSGGVGGAGRDHWTHCMSVLFAGGGIRGGQVHGSSDRIGAYPNEGRVTPEDVAKTVYHAMGIDDLEMPDREGRRIHLMPDGEPIRSLF